MKQNSDLLNQYFTGNKRYNDYGTYIRNIFSGRVQKISLDTGFTCPNRDGLKGKGGCTYCNNNSFTTGNLKSQKSITEQLNEGVSFFSKRYSSQLYLAYFQSYTNTYADIGFLKILYNEALNHPKIVGLVIGTRPDCISEELIAFLSELAKTYFISLEFGVESTLNRSLEKINRCHTYEDTLNAFNLTKNKGIHVGAHLIIGLPGESEDDIFHHASELSRLPVNSLKLHQLQIVKHTMMARQFKTNPKDFNLYSADSYISFLGKFIARLNPEITLDRFVSESPPNLLIAPKWNLKNYKFVALLDKHLIENDLWQGKYFVKTLIFNMLTLLVTKFMN